MCCKKNLFTIYTVVENFDAYFRLMPTPAMMRGTGPPPQNLYEHNFSYQTNSGYSKSVERRVLMQRLKEEREGQGQPFPVGFGETYPGHPTGGPPEFATRQQAAASHLSVESLSWVGVVVRDEQFFFF